jgi:hypothetical protein
MARTKLDPRRSASPPSLPDTVNINDFKIALETRRRHNVMWDAAQQEYEDYGSAQRALGSRVWLLYEQWLETQIRGPHPGWEAIRGLNHRYSERNLSFKAALAARSRSNVARRTGGRPGGPSKSRGGRAPLHQLATKAAGRALVFGGAASSRSASAAAAAAAAPGDESDSSAVDLTLSDPDLGDAADFVPSDDVTVLFSRSAPVRRSASDSGAALVRTAGASSVIVAPARVGGAVGGGVAAASGSNSLRLRLPIRPGMGGAVASPALVCPFHVYARGKDPVLYVRAAGAVLPPVNVFRVPADGSLECPLRYGPAPTGLPWQCSHLLCATPHDQRDRKGTEPHYWCAHHYDLCVTCATALAPAAGAAAVAVPLMDAYPLEFDGFGRETVTEAEGESTFSGPLRRVKSDAPWLPFSVCRIHHSQPSVSARPAASGVRVCARSVCCPGVALTSAFCVSLLSVRSRSIVSCT